MKVKNLIVGLIGFMFVAPVFFTACEEDGNEVSTTDTIVSIDTIYLSDTIFSVDTIFSSDTVYLSKANVFMLKFNHSADPEDTDMYATFAMNSNNLSQIPTIEVNGTEMEDFYTRGPILYGSLEIPYGQSVQYSISKGDSTTSGNLIMPEITEGLVNDSSLLGVYGLEIPEVSSFKASWQFENYDFIRLEKRDDHPWMDEQVSFIESDAYALTVDTTDASINYIGNRELQLNELNFYAIKGIGPKVSGMAFTPNVSGDYGDGYVTATERHGPTWVEMEPSLKSAQTNERREPQREHESQKKQLDQLVEDYKQIIKNRL